MDDKQKYPAFVVRYATDLACHGKIKVDEIPKTAKWLKDLLIELGGNEQPSEGGASEKQLRFLEELVRNSTFDDITKDNMLKSKYSKHEASETIKTLRENQKPTLKQQFDRKVK